MSRIITLPPPMQPQADGSIVGGWWHDEPESGRIVCDLCPRECHLKPGDRGFCFVRENRAGELVLTTYGRSTGFCIDPIEKKPLNHFFPGTSVLSFGTAGCNLGCKFCQNWDISKSREVERLSEIATPEAIAEAARQSGCHSVAFTYNDPVIWAEYAIDTAKACRAAGIKSVAVTAGYITPAARGPFYEFMDAANVDLKGFTEDFYHKITYSHLQPVLDTLEWLQKETSVWFEITNLIIPQANDSMDEIGQMCDWILQHVGDEVPVHFTAFHPDFRMRDRPNTPHETLLRAYDVGRKAGLKHVYTGNVNDVAHQSTYCPHCGQRLIERDWYALGEYRLNGNRCGYCDGEVAGHFQATPGNWGRRRLPIQISRFQSAPTPSPSIVNISAKGSPMSVADTTVQNDAGKSIRPTLSAEQQRLILHAANEIVAAEVCGRAIRFPDSTLAGAAHITLMGAFVTLKRQNKLRACCGFLGRTMPLADALQNAARRTASEDTRLPPISPSELPFLDLDVSLLYGFQPIAGRGHDRVNGVTVGQHGLQIRRGDVSGLLLPIVPVEHHWDSETFLRQVCRKAGLPTTAWEDDATELVTFENFAFGGEFDQSVLNAADVAAAPRFSDEEIRQLAAHCQTNVVALAEGATPNYYLFGVSDGTVSGAALLLHVPRRDEPVRVAKISLRPGLPLQATLFQLAESGAGALRNLRISAADLAGLRVDVAVLYDSAMHGTSAEPDLRGLEPTRRALLAMEHGKSVWIFDPASSPESLLTAVLGELRVMNPEAVSLFSLTAQSTATPVSVSTVPPAVAGSAVRPSALAGTFFPSDPAELRGMVDEFLAATPRRTDVWPAVMVPHAGLRFSGQIAANVFQQIHLPELILVIGPKHTRLGVEWAVAPHEQWLIPGATIQSDPEVARQLAAAIPGLMLDAAAHQQEHAIEIELPFLARLAPESRVVGIALGGGNLERCRQFATGLASVVRSLAKPPLLVISSDMNHFATDSENRRLDEIALRAMETLDPAALLQTVTDHNISMCGVLPAVIVMETLRQLNGLTMCQRVGYATSADVTGDTTRVVGYAGMLLR